MRFGFLINEVVTGLRRNVTMTVAMILTTAISIGLFGGGRRAGCNGTASIRAGRASGVGLRQGHRCDQGG